MTETGLGRIPDPPDERDYLWRGVVPPGKVSLPPGYESKWKGPVLNQGTTPQCVAYSSASVKLHQEGVEHHRYYQFDAPELYARCKERDGYPDSEGTTIRAAVEILRERGMYGERPDVPRRLWPIQSYRRLLTRTEIQEATRLRGVVFLGIMVDEGIMDPPGGMIPEPNGNPVGGHAMAVVGYTPSGLLVKNSWSSSWGRDGYGTLPYSHLEAYSDWDSWRCLNLKEEL